MMRPINLLDYGELNLFQPTVWKFKYEFDWKNLSSKVEELFNEVSKNSNLEKGDAWSTASLPSHKQPHTWKELISFQKWLGVTLDGIKNNLNFQIMNSSVTNSWINCHRHGGETIEHNHNNVTFVVSCYLQCPPNSGYIVFKDPLEYHKSSWPIFPEEHLYQEIPVSTNDILIFPGFLKHYVQPNLSNDPRYVLTFNIR